MRTDEPVPSKTIIWVGSTKDDLSKFPDPVRRILGQALFEAECGKIHQDASPMKGNLRDVTEIRVDEDGDTYRTMYTTKLGDCIYALHAFQKKSTTGSATPKRHLDLILQRLKEAKHHHAESTKRQESKSEKSSGSRKKGSTRKKRREIHPR